MESIYYVMAWACHRRCTHCYDDRFRPYARGDLEAVVAEAERNFPRIVEHFPDRMTYLDLDDPHPDGTLPEKIGRVILSGGESLLDPVRERVTYRVIESLQEKYRSAGGVRVVVQTTGDLVTDAIVDDLLSRGVWMISVSGVDDFHVGLAGPARQRQFIDTLTQRFERHGMRAAGVAGARAKQARAGGPAVQLLRRDPRFVDRQAVAAGARVAERTVDGDARRQFL